MFAFALCCSGRGWSESCLKGQEESSTVCKVGETVPEVRVLNVKSHRGKSSYVKDSRDSQDVTHA